MLDFLRPDGRKHEELRPIEIETGIAPNATGSVLIKFGKTQVICSATIENKLPRWMHAQGLKGGWLTAEYSMLPYSTLERKDRDSTRGKVDGRSIEIQRLIGRSLRAVLDLGKMEGKTLWVDCDVLQADGGTRTASITGAYVAAKLAVQRLMGDNVLSADPFNDSVAAVSTGVFFDEEVLDLNYHEDKEASVDANIVMTGSGKFIEVQSSGEEATYSEKQLQRLIELGKIGIKKLTEIQNKALSV
ncbi:MAG: ribonuclease PH [Opitutales bacterium]|nr:ribonuclease PH [Opitutales bacterium]